MATNSPSLDAAALPLSTAALTAPTSPRTITVTSPDPIFSVPVSYTHLACLQLAATDDSITEIAYRNGFNDLSYFIRTFKKYKGMTPGKYKRR